MKLLKRGDKGPAVIELQQNLTKLGYDVGTIDGDYGAKTEGGVLAFQLDYSDISDDGVYGPQTDQKLRKVLSNAAVTPPQTTTYVPCNAATFAAFEKVISTITSKPVRYGPGRGLFRDGKFLVTFGAGDVNLKNWKNFIGTPYPSFHCTSFTNFILGWLLRRNENYTHAGNIPELFDLLSQSAAMHESPQDGWTLRYRGYGDACFKLEPDGSGAKRNGVGNYFDARELFDRRAELPTFIVCGQSTKFNGVWKWWHHTVLFVAREGKLFRIAADGYRDATRGWSGQPLKYVEITAQTVGAYAGAIYQAYGVRPDSEGNYGDPTKPIAAVDLES
jgi:hypothetical protein